MKKTKWQNNVRPSVESLKGLERVGRSSIERYSATVIQNSIQYFELYSMKLQFIEKNLDEQKA